MTTEKPSFWYAEHESDHVHYYVGVRSGLFEGRTKFQDVTILDTYEWGKMLILDGVIQSTEEDEAIYHEALVHPVMLTHENPRSVLIIGGGEGATLREVTEYRSLERIVMVDIDQELVEICQQHLPEWHEQRFEDPRVKLVFEDGMEYVKRCKSAFDIIIIDLVDSLENELVRPLYEEAFYSLIRSRLSRGGILVVQAMELSAFEPAEYADHVSVRNALRRVFSQVRTYTTYVPSFRAEWAFLVASDGPDPGMLSRELLVERLAERGPVGDIDIGEDLDFYDADAHVRMFSLPKDIKEALSTSMIKQKVPSGATSVTLRRASDGWLFNDGVVVVIGDDKKSEKNRATGDGNTTTGVIPVGTALANTYDSNPYIRRVELPTSDERTP